MALTWWQNNIYRNIFSLHRKELTHLITMFVDQERIYSQSYVTMMIYMMIQFVTMWEEVTKLQFRHWFLTVTTRCSLGPQTALCMPTGLMIWPLGFLWDVSETVEGPQGALSASDQVAEPLRFFCACSKEAPWSWDLSHLWWSCRESTATPMRLQVALGDLTEFLETPQGLVVRSDDI